MKNTRLSAGLLACLLLAVGTVAPLAADTVSAGRSSGYGASPPGNRDRIVRTGMTVLGGWAVANIATGIIGMLVAEDPAARGFWEMNAMWNTVNLGLAGWSLYDLSRSGGVSADMDIEAYREESHGLEKVLLFNAGLNFAYMAVGGWMWDRGMRGYGLPAADISANRLRGWGQSMVLQGAFLLAFDLSMARVVARDREGVR